MQVILTVAWLTLTLVAIRYGYREERIKYVLVLWFFFSSGFQLVPPAAFDTTIGLNKAPDFGILALVIVLWFNRRKYFAGWKKDRLLRIMFVFLFFVAVAALHSYFVLNIGLASVIRSSRYFLILLLYLEFRLFTADQFRQLVKYLMTLTLFQSVVFLLQFAIGIQLLNTGLYESELKEVQIGGLNFPRFYSFPLLGPFFFFEAMSHFGMRLDRFLTIGLLAAPLILPMHRSWIFALLACTVIVLLRSRVQLKTVIGVGTLLIVPVAITLQERLKSGVIDLVNTLSGGYDMTNFQDTLSFRIAHALERLLYVLGSPETFVFGAGMLTEDSPQASLLDFLVGYKDEIGGVLQVNMGDIAWSLLFLRLGIVGTMLFLALYLRSIALVWSSPRTSYSTSAFAYLILFLMTMVTSSLTIEPHMLASLGMLVALSSVAQVQLRRL